MEDSKTKQQNKRMDETDKEHRHTQKDLDKDIGKDRNKGTEGKEEGGISFFQSKFWKKKKEMHIPGEPHALENEKEGEKISVDDESDDLKDSPEKSRTGPSREENTMKKANQETGTASETVMDMERTGKSEKEKGKPIIIDTETLTQEGIDEILRKVRPRTTSDKEKNRDRSVNSRTSSNQAPGSTTSSTGQKRKRTIVHDEIQIISDEEEESDKTRSPGNKKKRNVERNEEEEDENGKKEEEEKEKERYKRKSQIGLLKKIRKHAEILAEVATEPHDRKGSEGKNLEKIVKDMNIIFDVLINKIEETGKTVVKSLDTSRIENQTMRKELRTEKEKRTELEAELSLMLHRHGRIVEELRNDTSDDNRMIRNILERDEITRKNLEGLGQPQARSSPKDKDTTSEDKDILRKVEDLIDQKLDKRLGNIEKLLNERFGEEKERTKKTSTKNIEDTRSQPKSDSGNVGFAVKEQPWSQVIGRRAGKESKKVSGTPATKGAEEGSQKGNRVKQTNAKMQATAINRIRNNRSTAIVLKDAKGRVEDVLKEIQKKVNIQKYDFSSVKTKKSQAGHIVLELEGDLTGQKTRKLQEEINKATETKDDVKVYMPERFTEIMIKNLDLTLEAQDIKILLAETCGVDKNNISVGKINVYRNGTRNVWAKCPTRVVGLLFEKSGAKQMMGWSTVEIEILKARPVQCFRCWGYGHMAPQCKNKEDYTGWCFKCGTQGHTPEICISQPGCRLCRVANEECSHRMGSKDCNALRRYLTKNSGVAEPSKGVAEPTKNGNQKKSTEGPEKEEEGNKKPENKENHLKKDTTIMEDIETEMDDDDIHDLNERGEVYV